MALLSPSDSCGPWDLADMFVFVSPPAPQCFHDLSVCTYGLSRFLRQTRRHPFWLARVVFEDFNFPLPPCSTCSSKRTIRGISQPHEMRLKYGELRNHLAPAARSISKRPNRFLNCLLLVRSSAPCPDERSPARTSRFNGRIKQAEHSPNSLRRPNNSTP